MLTLWSISCTGEVLLEMEDTHRYEGCHMLLGKDLLKNPQTVRVLAIRTRTALKMLSLRTRHTLEPLAWHWSHWSAGREHLEGALQQF